MLELYSFNLCPYVQRTIILLKLGEIDFKVNYIDINNKPKELFEISPDGKVPAIKTAEGSLFESSIINEYLNQKHNLGLYSKTPFLLAKERIAIALIDKALSSYFNCLIAKNKEIYLQKISELKDDFRALLEERDLLEIKKLGKNNIVNIALYPFVQRLLLGGDICKELPIEKPFLEDYIRSFKLYDSYNESVTKDFDSMFVNFLVQEKKSYILTEGTK